MKRFPKTNLAIRGRDGTGKDEPKDNNNDDNYPPDIQQSLTEVRKSIAARMATKCHGCQSNLVPTTSSSTTLTPGSEFSFSVKSWMRRWTEGAKGNPKGANLLCSASCGRCAVLTCLGCGEEPRGGNRAREVDGYFFDWCCRDGRLFGIWMLLARFDQVELHVQASSSAAASASAGVNRSVGGGGGSRKGVGYAGRTIEELGPFNPFQYGGMNMGMGMGMGPRMMGGGLTAPVDFKASETKTDGLLGTILELISEMVPGKANRNLPPELHGMLQLGLLVDKVAELLRNDSLDDVTARVDLYSSALRFVGKLGAHPELIGLVQTSRYYKQRTPGLDVISLSSKAKVELVLGGKIASVGERFKQLAKQSEIVNSAAGSGAMTSRSGKTMLALCREITAIYNKIATDGGSGDDAKSKDKWEIYHQKYAISQDEGVFDQYHMYYSKAYYMDQSHPGRMKRLVTEVANMATSLPVGIFVRVGDSRPDVMRCLIVGPPDSPYAYGLFDFDLFCGPQYPNQPPEIKCSTVMGREGFNPNLHADGTVCLSLLGTYHRGDAAAQWQPGKSTILSVLISIQAMIFNEDPIRNAPGFGEAEGLGADLAARKYIESVQPQTIQLGMLNWIGNRHQRNEIWSDVVRAHFKYNRAKILDKVDRWAQSNSVIRRNGLAQQLRGRLDEMSVSRSRR